VSQRDASRAAPRKVINDAQAKRRFAHVSEARRRPGVFLVHPGGPFWAKKDYGAWSIPKGEYAEGEDVLKSAQREFHEETDFTAEGPCGLIAPQSQQSL
jgi:predicted NUDIX family NTP pyrophosphohydrolase